jgi:hypothetical protein
VGLAALVVSGGSSSDPRTPAALPGLPPPFLTTSVLGDGGLTAGVDSYGDVVDLRAPGPAGAALIDNPVARQEAGTVPADTGIVPRVSVGDGPARPLWRAASVRQRYLPGTNVLRTSARFAHARVTIECAAGGGRLGCLSGATDPSARVSFGGELDGGTAVADGGARIHLDDDAAERIVTAAAARDRHWLARALPLANGAPPWAGWLYTRSLLALRALADSRSGAVAAGARDGWAYVWPRDAGAAALALAAAGYRREARRVARFLLGLDLNAAARFAGDGAPVPGRAAQGDAWGWAAAAARATGLPPPPGRPIWRDRADYQEKSPGDYLANAIASIAITADGPDLGLVRRIGDPGSGLDSAAAWAVRPFPRPALFPAVRTALQRLLADGGRFGIVPSEDWPDAAPWTAPTAWSAWSLAALGERRQALRLLGDLRRASTPAGLLPERVGARSGLPLSTAPLAWSHAFAILAIRQLWPGRPHMLGRWR